MAAREVAGRMAEAAGAWLATLDRKQLAEATGAVPADDGSDAERRRWFYTPTDHGGLTFHEQRPAQQRAAMRLVSTGLSPAGYVTVATIIGLENVLDRVEGFTARFDRERGRDPGLHYLRVFRDPAGQAPWGWRFGGHPRLGLAPGGRGPGGRLHTVVPGSRPGLRTAAQFAPAPAGRPGGSGARADAIARRAAAETRVAAAEGPAGHHRRQPDHAHP
jgi:hypothetical protein